MQILDADGIKKQNEAIVQAIKDGSIFIYPTDTIYGIGCNAQDSKSVAKIRKIKSRATNPFSVIAPSMEWISQNCVAAYEGEEWIKKLPGPYTLIFRLKNKKCIAKETNLGLDTLGIRIPKHWIKDIVAKADVPFITTSVNKSGEDYMTSIEDLDDSIKNSVDFIINEGKREGRPSKIVDLTGKVKVIER